MKRASSDEYRTPAAKRKDLKQDVCYMCMSPSNKFDQKFPYFRKPVEVGCFSLDDKRIFSNGRHQMKFYYPPENPNNVHFDLTIGHKDMIKKNEDKPDLLDDLLRWIQCNMSVFRLHNETTTQRDLHTDFVCWRGLITRLLCTPFEDREGWKISVCFFNNTYYMCEYDTEKKKMDKANCTERQDEMSYWGWKFEQYVTSDTEQSRPDTTKAVNNNEAFCTVVRSRLNTHSLVYGGEVDGAMRGSSGDKHSYVEYKTSLEIQHKRQDYNFKRFKLIKWWAQSFLVGIERIVCGFRDHDGIVHNLQTFDTQKIPDLAKDLRNPWLPNVCFNFLDQFLAFLKDSIKTQSSSVYLVEWEPGVDVSCHKLEGDSPYHFLPKWYTDQNTSEYPP